MSGTDRPSAVVEIDRPRPGWLVNFADFANMVKAFIGSNYLSVAYAFSQSGLALGIGGMLLIAGLTDHCCHLLVKTKYHIIRNILEKQRRERHQAGQIQEDSNRYSDTAQDQRSEDEDDDDMKETKSFMRRSLEHEGISVEDESQNYEQQEAYMKKHMSFGDVGKFCFGKAGIGVVNFCIALTQFGFCVGYFIFLGNTIHSLFPVHECYKDRVTGYMSCHVQDVEAVKNTFVNSSIDRFPRSLDLPVYDSEHNSSIASLFGKYAVGNVTDAPVHNSTTVVPERNITVTALPSNSSSTTPQSNITTSAPPSNITTSVPSNITTPESNVTWSTLTEIVIIEHAPNLIWLVAAPLPVFLLFALIRSVRYLGIISVLANISILFGCVSIFCFLVVGFSIDKTVTLVNIHGFAVFFGMVTGSFEGIGLVIPVESSMEGNRHLFPLFLHLAMLVLTLILGFFGIFGYLRNGIGVHQMLNKNIPRGHPLGMAVNVGICIGILLTFPLQIFPVIEIVEKQLFTPGAICGPRKSRTIPSDDSDEEENLIRRDQEPLMDDNHDIAVRVPDSVPTWKRNVLRIFIVLVACSLAILLRHYFAYVGAFIGSVGSSVLGFILPCLFHLKICWKDINVFVKAKNILIILLGFVASVVCAVSVIIRVARNEISV